MYNLLSSQFSANPRALNSFVSLNSERLTLSALFSVKLKTEPFILTG